MNHSPYSSSEAEAIECRRYVVVKFADEASLPEGAFRFDDVADQLPPTASPIDPDIVFGPHLGGRIPSGFKVLVEHARKFNPDFRPPNPLAFRRIDVDSEGAGQELVPRLRSWPIVDYAYLHPGAVPPPMAAAGPELLIDKQSYLKAAPVGIDAEYAWTRPGGRAEQQRLADVEWGWNQGHLDLAGHNFLNIEDGHYRARPHGTAVLGIIAAHDDENYCTGIAPALEEIVTSGQWTSPTQCVTDAAVFAAVNALGPGDVLLLEAQTDMYGYSGIPLEAEPGVRTWVKFAYDTGIIVVAAAGNGAVGLDMVTDDSGAPVFSQADADSGAIIVAAGNPDSQPEKWARESFSCWGNRVDCFAQGSQVTTLNTDYWGTDNTATRDDFSGTSSAAAIVAGAALAIQGAAQEVLGNPLGPDEVRELLSDASLNTASAQGHKIGVMPNLRCILEKLLPPTDTIDEPAGAKSGAVSAYGPGEAASTPKEEAKSMADKTIHVYFDTTKNPPVQVDPIVLGRSKMKWRKEDSSQDFTFKNIDFDPSEPFSLTKVDDDKIDADNTLAPGDFKYTLTIEASDGTLYTTTEAAPPPGAGDKPVIRN